MAEEDTAVLERSDLQKLYLEFMSKQLGEEQAKVVLGFFAKLRQPIILLDKDYRPFHITEEAAEIFGYTPRQVIKDAERQPGIWNEVQETCKNAFGNLKWDSFGAFGFPYFSTDNKCAFLLDWVISKLPYGGAVVDFKNISRYQRFAETGSDILVRAPKSIDSRFFNDQSPLWPAFDEVIVSPEKRIVVVMEDTREIADCNRYKASTGSVLEEFVRLFRHEEMPNLVALDAPAFVARQLTRKGMDEKIHYSKKPETYIVETAA